MSFQGLGQTQPEAAAILQELISSNNVPPCMLFCGKPYSGKMFAAMKTANALGSDNQSTIIISDRNHNYRIKTALKLFRDFGNNASKKFLADTVNTFLSQFNGAMSDSQSSANKKKFSGAGDCADLISGLKDVPENQSKKAADEIEKALNSLIDLKNGPSQMKMTSISIGQVRALKDWCSTSSLEGKRKTIIIEGLENSSSGAINSLLKILEEPPKDTSFILISSNPGRMPATILSRVRKINFKSLGEKEKKYVLSSIFINPNDYEDLETFFVEYSGVNDKLLKETAAKAIKKQQYDLPALAEELEKTQAWDRFFSHVVKEIRKGLLENSIEERRARYLLDEINNAVSSAKAFVQTRRMTLDFVLFRIKEVL